MHVVRKCAVGVAAFVMVGAAVAGARAEPSSDANSVAAGGMYGELGGGGAVRAGAPAAQGTSSEASAVTDYASGGTRCSMYANNAGMGSYCSSGDGVYESLVKRFPDLRFENCRYADPPAGVEIPRNPDPAKKEWKLRSCLTGIDWLSYDGGDDRRFSIDLVLVDRDRDTTYHPTRLSEFLWDSVRTTYPIPILQVEPRHIPVVGQHAFFTFDWVNGETSVPVSQGPYANASGGGPYIEHRNRGMVMRAHAAAMTIDPQIEGVRPFSCTVDRLGYDERSAPDPGAQASDCHHRFTRSSAAADELGTAESGSSDTFEMKIDIRWDVEYGGRGRGFQRLGRYHMVVYQDLPVQDVQAVNRPLPDGGLG